MRIEKVLDFRTFHGLNEADEQSAVISAADQIVNLFFSAYSALVTKIGKYPDAIKDLISVGESKAENKGTAMSETINKIAKQVDPKYTEAANEMVLAGKKIKEAYETLIGTEDGKKQLEGINEKIYKKIIAQNDALKAAASDLKGEKAITDSLEHENDSALFEKLFDKTFTQERNQLINDIAPLLAQVTELAKNSPTQELKSKCTEFAKNLREYINTLSTEKNEEEWNKMKRKERVTKLEEITNKVNSMPKQIQEIQTKALIQLGIDKKVQSSIESAKEAFTNAMVTLNKEDEKKIEVSAEKKAEAAKEASKEKEGEKKEEEKKEGGEKEEIVSGTVDVINLKKAGKNREAIMDAQKKMNMLLSDDAKIKDDGLYGKNTEEAIKKVAAQYSSIAPEIKGLDGKKMTPAFRKFLDNFEKNKEKIAALFK
jgi:hypothetical protein